MRNVCIHCGNKIYKSARSDPYMCRDCDRIVTDYGLEERFWYLDRWNE